MPERENLCECWTERRWNLWSLVTTGNNNIGSPPTQSVCRQSGYQAKGTSEKLPPELLRRSEAAVFSPDLVAVGNYIAGPGEPHALIIQHSSRRTLKHECQCVHACMCECVFYWFTTSTRPSVCLMQRRQAAPERLVSRGNFAVLHPARLFSFTVLCSFFNW